MSANLKWVSANPLRVATAIASVAALLSFPAFSRAQTPAASPGSKAIGTVKSINATSILLVPDNGANVTVVVQPATRFLRVAPGEKNLTNAASIQAQDLQVGDRILVAGKLSDDNASLVASTVVVMTKSDLEAQHQREMEDWQKRGVDGIVTAVDPGAGTVTISVRSKPLIIHTSSSTVIRRYPPDSTKFDDAKPSTLREIHSGDQVRARGERSADVGDLTADEIVSGSFRNIAGTVNSVDASSSTLSIHDLLSKKNVTVKVTTESQLRHLPPEMAQRLAMRLKRAAGGAATSRPENLNAGNPPTGRQAGATGAMATGGGGAARASGGAPNLQQMLSRMPEVALADLHKGDAVVILSTEGAAGVGTAITLLTGVEPILEAAPNASGASILTPWSLSAPTGDAGGP
jgi:hypothetical protein